LSRTSSSIKRVESKTTLGLTSGKSSFSARVGISRTMAKHAWLVEGFEKRSVPG
jgi:hypothetical protein